MSQKKRMLKLLVSAVLVMILAFSMVAPVFAGKDAAATSEAAITKILKVPYGTTIPAGLGFKFDVAKVSLDDETDTAALAKMPAIGEVTISGSFNLEGTAPVGPDADGNWVYYLESANLFPTTGTGKITWPSAGIYEYEITEKNSIVGGPLTAKENLTLSEAVYSLKVYVTECDDEYDDQCTDPNHPGHLIITHIGAMMIVDDEGDGVADSDQEKVDPTPGGGSGTTYNYSQMKFTNIYTKNGGGVNPEDPEDWALYVGKRVSGNYANQSIYFTFSLKLVEPKLVDGPNTYKAYVVEANSDYPGVAGSKPYKVVTVTANGTVAGNDANGHPYINVTANEFGTSSESTQFKLKHGQYLVFVDMPIGTSYSITESATDEYQPLVTVAYAGGSLGGIDGTKNDAISIPPILGLDKVTPINTIYVGETVGARSNGADFNNKRITSTPTGITVDDLPFIVMIGIAVIVLVVYVGSRARKARNEK